jgi:Domain of unknown function (DUF4034)
MTYSPNPALAQKIVQDTQLRDRLRRCLKSGEYAELETELTRMQATWHSGQVFADPDYEAYCIGDMLFGDDYENLNQQIEVVQKWVNALPRSYHANLVLGNLWTSVGAEIRGSGYAQSVSPAQWLGAQMARDKTCALLLYTTNLSPKPALAYAVLMQVTSYLGEPEWLEALFQGETENVQRVQPRSHRLPARATCTPARTAASRNERGPTLLAATRR